MYEYLETDWYRANAYTFYEMDMRIVNEARGMDLESFQRQVIKFNRFKEFVIFVGIIIFCFGLVTFFFSGIDMGLLIIVSFFYLPFLGRVISLKKSFNDEISRAKDKIKHCINFFSEMAQLHKYTAYRLGHSDSESEICFDCFGQFMKSQNSVRSELINKYNYLLEIENLL